MRNHIKLEVDFKYFVYDRRTRIPKEWDGYRGIYIILNVSGEIIYVGKSINLRKRANKYFCKKETDRIAIIPLTEKTCYSLEASAIRHFKPRYNRGSHQPKDLPWSRLCFAA
jgi:excinuclease UvrABC nuclease subunit